MPPAAGLHTSWSLPGERESNLALPLARLHVAAWRAAYRGLVPDEFLDGLDPDARAARFRSWLAAGEAENHAARVLLVHRSERPAATVGYLD